MGLNDSLSLPQVLALDTNVLISAFNKSGTNGLRANNLLDKILEILPRVYISVIVFEEFLVQIYKRKLEKRISYYEDFITGGGVFTVIEVNRSIAREAAKLRADYNLRAPDAIHLASAIEAGTQVFFSFDRRLPRKVEKLIIRQP